MRSSDVGDTIDVVVTTSNAGGSRVRGVGQHGRGPGGVFDGAREYCGSGVVSGTAQVPDKLTASKGSWSISPSSYGYQWRDCDASGGSCQDISGASSSTYTVASGDIGDTIDVVVTASNAGGSGSAASASTGVVQAASSTAPLNTAVPTISGTAV